MEFGSGNARCEVGLDELEKGTGIGECRNFPVRETIVGAGLTYDGKEDKYDDRRDRHSDEQLHEGEAILLGASLVGGGHGGVWRGIMTL